MSATRTVFVWHVAYCIRLAGKWVPCVAVFRDPGEAAQAAKMREGDRNYACIVTSGPFEQEVPTQ